jgi:hypothetical protein
MVDKEHFRAILSHKWRTPGDGREERRVYLMPFAFFCGTNLTTNVARVHGWRAYGVRADVAGKMVAG